MRLLVIALVCASVVCLAPTAIGSPSENALVRPGVGIGELKLGMTIPHVRHALGRELMPIRSKVLDDARFIEFQTRDAIWRVAFLGPRGRERLARVISGAPRERTREGVGIGTDVAAIPSRLRAFRPECRNSTVFLNYNSHHDRMTSCALIGLDALTVFSGRAECAVPPVRYQGCPRIRVPVGRIAVESRALVRHQLSWWYPEPDRTGSLRPGG